MDEIEYSCCFWEGTVSAEDRTSHLDPCSLVLIGHFDFPYGKQKEQQFFCHFQSFRKATKIGDVFYIEDEDFAPNSEIDDETEEDLDTV